MASKEYWLSCTYLTAFMRALGGNYLAADTKAISAQVMNQL